MKQIFLSSYTSRVARVILALAIIGGLFSCEDEESALGIDLVDPSTLYYGITDTLYADQAWSQLEDSLLTSNYSFGVIGALEDAVFGKTTATLFAQVALPAETRMLDFSAVEVDSVVLTLAKYSLHPDTAATYRFRFEVKQLAQAVETDKRYYSTDELPVDESTLFYDEYVQVGYGDSVVRLVLDRSVLPILTQVAETDSFASTVKGLRIRIGEGSDNGMLGIDFTSTATCITAYYHYTYEGDLRTGEYVFMMGTGASHFTQFTHDYAGTRFAANDSIDGGDRLYLEPLGGHTVHLRFDSALRAFHVAHPNAAIHHAELIMPVASESGANVPERLLLLNKVTSDSLVYINDLLDLYTLQGFDGYYHADQKYFRMRVTQHLQGLLRKGSDNGMVVLIDARRHTTAQAIFNGRANETAAPRIVFVYSE